MRSHTIITLLLTFLTTLALASQSESTIDIHYWPLSPSKSSSLAKINYTPTNATVKSYTPPALSSFSDDIVRIGFYHPTTNQWSGVATSASNFKPGKDKKVQLHLNTADELYHVGFAASRVGSSSASGKGKAAKGKGEEDVLDVEVVKVQEGEGVRLNKPVVLDPEGKVPTKEVEKSFLQKYWWVIGGFLLLQVVMGGSKE